VGVPISHEPEGIAAARKISWRSPDKVRGRRRGPFGAMLQRRKAVGGTPCLNSAGDAQQVASRRMTRAAMSVEISLSGPGTANHDGGRPHPATIAARDRKVVNESRYVRDESSNFVRLALGEPESDRTSSHAGVPGPTPVQKEFVEHFAVPVLHDVFAMYSDRRIFVPPLPPRASSP
jgi:hypothetical protein